MERINHKTLSECLQAEFSWPKNFDWIGSDGFVELPERRIAKISLLTEEHGFVISGFRAEIISKDKGRIDSKNFMFKSYLKVGAEAEIDNVFVHPFMTTDETRSRWGSHSDKAKHVSVAPKTTTPIVEAIRAYINLFR